MVDELSSALGPIELLVNNADVFHYVSHEQTLPIGGNLRHVPKTQGHRCWAHSNRGG